MTCLYVNYNVMGIVDAGGALVERYEYDPYGQRRVYISAGSNDPDCMDPPNMSRRRAVGSVEQPWGRCDVGHQGLIAEAGELGLLMNRLRDRNGGWLQRDPLGYVDGMSLYAASHHLDPSGGAKLVLDADAFIPWAWVSIPPDPAGFLHVANTIGVSSYVHGDDRLASLTPMRENKTRVHNWVEFDTCPYDKSFYFTSDHGIGLSARKDEVTHIQMQTITGVGGMPLVSIPVIQHSTFVTSGTGSRKSKEWAKEFANGAVGAGLIMSGNVPFKVAKLPIAIDYWYILKVSHVGYDVKWELVGQHDAFPGHEVYLSNDTGVFWTNSYTPPASSTSWITYPAWLYGAGSQKWVSAQGSFKAKDYCCPHSLKLVPYVP